MDRNLNNNKKEIYSDRNKFDFDYDETNEFSKENYLVNNKKRNVLYIGNTNNRNNFQSNAITNDHDTRMTNFNPRNPIPQYKNNFDISAGKNKNGFYRSYDRPKIQNCNPNNRNKLASPLKKADDILFIPCINCNQLIKVDEIEQHSEVCVSYSNDFDNGSNKDILKVSMNSKNKSEDSVISNNKHRPNLDKNFKRNDPNSIYFQPDGSNNTGKFGLSNINMFTNSNSKKLNSHDFTNGKSKNLVNLNDNNIETHLEKQNEINIPRFSNYSNNLILNSNTFLKNEGAAGFSSNLNSFLDFICENDTLNYNRNVNNQYSNNELIYRNRVINEKLNKILCQINEVDFRMNVIPSEDHYIFSIENYLLDSIKWGNIDPQNIENNLDKIYKNYVNTEALMISFNGSINIHIILKKVKDLLQEKVKIMRLFLKNNNNNNVTLEKSKSRIIKSDLDALENEIRKKKEICDKINFEKELALIKVKNLKKSVIDTSRKTADKKFNGKNSKQNYKSCDFIENVFESVTQEPRLTYQKKGSNKEVLDKNARKNTATFKNINEFDKKSEYEKDKLKIESKERINDISFNKQIQFTDSLRENRENIDDVINKKQHKGSEAEEINDVNEYSNNFNGGNKNIYNAMQVKNKVDNQETEINNQIIKTNGDINYTAEAEVVNNKNKKAENPVQKELFDSLKVKTEKDLKIKDPANALNISKIEKADNINHNFKLSKDIEKENFNPNFNETDLNKKKINFDSKSDHNRDSKKSGFLKENRFEAASSNKKSAKSKDDEQEIYGEKIIKKKKRKNESKSSFEAELVIDDPEYIKEMKELYKLFKKNLLKIKFEKFPNNENCNKKHLNLKFPEREIFNNLIKQNIPEEEWYDFIYEEILNFNCLQTLKTPDYQHYQIKSTQKKSKLEDSIM